MLKLIRGDTLFLDIRVSDEETGAPIDISGKQLTFSVKSSVDDTDEDAMLSESIVFPADAESVAGRGLLTVGSDKTYYLIPTIDGEEAHYDYELRTFGAPDVVETYPPGRCKIIGDVTRGPAP